MELMPIKARVYFLLALEELRIIPNVSSFKFLTQDSQDIQPEAEMEIARRMGFGL